MKYLKLVGVNGCGPITRKVFHRVFIFLQINTDDLIAHFHHLKCPLQEHVIRSVFVGFENVVLRAQPGLVSITLCSGYLIFRFSFIF